MKFIHLNIPNKKYIKIIIPVLILLTLIIILFPKWIVDDSFINFRYAKNFLEGKGLVYNKGIRVEGYTSLLQISLLIISPFDYIYTAHLLGIISFFLSLFFLYKLLINKTLVLFYVFAPILYVHIFSGLETVMFTFFLILNMYLFKNNSKFLIITLSLLSLCRPEGILLSLLIIIYAKETRLKYLAFLIFFIGVRFWYYGDILPNSFYVKSVSKGIWHNFINLFLFSVYYLLLPFALTIFAKTKLKVNKNILNVSLIFSAVCIIFYMHSYLEMNYSYRFFIHFYPLAIIAIDQFYNEHSSKIVVAIISIQFILYIFLFRSELEFVSDYKLMIENIHTKAGQFVHSKVTPNDWIVSDFDVGAIPFYAECNCLDLGGLNDKIIARGNLDMPHFIDYVFQNNPKVFIITSYEWDYLKHNERTKMIIKDERFRNYKLTEKYGIPEKKYYQFIYVKQ